MPPHRTNSQQQNNTNNNNNTNQPHIRSNPLSVDASIGNSKGGVLNTTHSSAQSLCSSELFSIDLNLETDSLELEWVTPEMVANGQYR